MRPLPGAQGSGPHGPLRPGSRWAGGAAAWDDRHAHALRPVRAGSERPHRRSPRGHNQRAQEGDGAGAAGGGWRGVQAADGAVRGWGAVDCGRESAPQNPQDDQVGWRGGDGTAGGGVGGERVVQCRIHARGGHGLGNQEGLHFSRSVGDGCLRLTDRAALGL